MLKQGCCVELSITLHNVLAAELLLGLLHDLQELLEADTAIARDIGLVDNLVNISLLQRNIETEYVIRKWASWWQK